MSTGMEAILTSKEASRVLKILPKVLQRMAKRGDVPALKVRKFWRYRASALTPPTTLGMFGVWYVVFPGSTRSGEKARKKSSPTLRRLRSSVGSKISSVVPGEVVLSRTISCPR